MRTRSRKFFMLLIAVLVIGMGTASASTITYLLDVSNVSYSGPYATLLINLNPAGTIATVTFTSLTSSGYTYPLGDSGVVALNVAGSFNAFQSSNVIAGSITQPAAATNTPVFSINTGKGALDGFGKYNFVLDDFDGWTSSLTSVSFYLYAGTGTTWSDAAHVLTANGGGYLAAAHIFPCTSGCTSDLPGGYASTDGTVVPEPASVGLIGTGLLVLVAVRASRRRKTGIVR